MKRFVSAFLLALTAACAAPEPEETMAADIAPAGMIGEAEMLAEPVTSPEVCDGSGDGIGGTGCPID